MNQFDGVYGAMVFNLIGTVDLIGEYLFCIEGDHTAACFTGPIDGSSPVIHTHTVEDGLQGHNFNRNAAAKGVDGILLFGGVHGLNVFDPKDIVYDKTHII